MSTEPIRLSTSEIRTMAAETMTSQEILQKVYLDPVTMAVPQSLTFQRNIRFDSANKVGESYNGAIQLKRPTGLTFWGGDSRGTAAALNDARAGKTAQVSVKPSSIMLREQVSYDLAASCNPGAAFSPELALITESMVESVNWALEMQLSYGGTNIGVANAVSSPASPAGTFQISKATWSPMIWGPFEGGAVDAYSDAALTVKVTNAGPATVTWVDADARNVRLTFSAGADYTAAAAAVATGLYFVPYGAFVSSTDGWVDGVCSLITKSAAGGTVFGLNTSLYAYARSSSIAISGALSFADVAAAVINPTTKGGMGDYTVVVNPYSWCDVMNDEAGLRRYVSDEGGEFVNGANDLTYYGPNGGALRFEMNPFIKASEAYLLMYDDWRNVGSTLPTFKLPNRDPQNNAFLLELPGNAGYELRRYSNVGTYCKRLARQAVLTGIVNASGPTGGGA